MPNQPKNLAVIVPGAAKRRIIHELWKPLNVRPDIPKMESRGSYTLISRKIGRQSGGF